MHAHDETFDSTDNDIMITQSFRSSALLFWTEKVDRWKMYNQESKMRKNKKSEIESKQGLDQAPRQQAGIGDGDGGGDQGG
jgi:hypothetical protein